MRMWWWWWWWCMLLCAARLLLPVGLNPHANQSSRTRFLKPSAITFAVLSSSLRALPLDCSLSRVASIARLDISTAAGVRSVALNSSASAAAACSLHHHQQPRQGREVV